MALIPKYDEFQNEPFIQTIKNNYKWTISDKDKRPIDFYKLIDEGLIVGAQKRDQSTLTTLETLHTYIPNAANYAYYLDAIVDNFVILDIESTCPQDLRDKFLKMNYLYAEPSMSGKGLHLVFKLPLSIYNYPGAIARPAIQEEHKYYEILINHFVTFTGNPLPLCQNPTENFDELFNQMAEPYKFIQERHDVEIEQLDEKPDHPCIDIVLDKLFDLAKNYKKTKNNFKDDTGRNDLNRYEFGTMVWIDGLMQTCLKRPSIACYRPFTEDEQAYIIVQVAKEIIPYREKHNTKRNGLPWLWYLAREVMAKSYLRYGNQTKTQ